MQYDAVRNTEGFRPITITLVVESENELEQLSALAMCSPLDVALVNMNRGEPVTNFLFRALHQADVQVKMSRNLIDLLVEAVKPYAPRFTSGPIPETPGGAIRYGDMQ